MAEYYGVKCSPLCQHPGCWFSGTKLEEMSEWPSGNAHCLSELATRRTCRTPDSHIHSHTVDGLPTLKVQTLTQEGISDNTRTRSNTSPAPLQCSKLASNPLTLPKVTYAQILLEEGDDGYTEDEIVLKRVLIWRPGLRKRSHDSSARTAVHEPGQSSPEAFDGSKGQDDKLRASKEEPTGTIGSISVATKSKKSFEKTEESSRTTSVADKPRPDQSKVGIDYQTTDKWKWSPNKTSKSMLKLYKTNLTGSLPSYSERHILKASTSLQQWNLKRFSSPDAVSLSYLGDIDLPPQVVEEILQQLRSESTSNTDNIDLGAQSLTQTPALNRLSSQKFKPSSLHRSYTALDHEQSDLSHKRVLNVSGSGLSVAAQRRLSQMTSFSRGLSVHPLDALKVHASNQKTRVSEQMHNVAEHKSSGWKEMGDDIGMDTSTHRSHPAQQNHQLAPLHLRASGHTSYLHTRDGGQTTGQSGPTPHSDHPSHKSTEVANDRWIVRGANDIMIPVETLRMPHTINLNLDSVSKHRIPSHSFKDSKVASRFISVPKSRYSPRWSQSQSANTEEHVTSGSYTQLFARGQTSRLGSTRSAAQKHPLQRLMCPSPDYMMVAAKFAEGQLILTDKEGLVTQHLTTDVESEPSVSPIGDNKTTDPPPNVGPIPESGSEPENSTEPDLPTHEEETEKRELLSVPVGSRAPPASAVEEVRRNR